MLGAGDRRGRLRLRAPAALPNKARPILGAGVRRSPGGLARVPAPPRPVA